jgi:hypothetical protein
MLPIRPGDRKVFSFFELQRQSYKKRPVIKQMTGPELIIGLNEIYV